MRVGIPASNYNLCLQRQIAPHHIKLAGFKSFVDPTHIPVPGQLVGVVGPNGCGKSNVIDAVRWVLGESSARHLRGETMQDVIFNGSGNRKPVESCQCGTGVRQQPRQGGGPVGDYAEISVKRVLERDGESAYYINNMHVRRRDVADIFLGTGLGARAYAIIEQGMISRIIEAKPEDLRFFSKRRPACPSTASGAAKPSCGLTTRAKICCASTTSASSSTSSWII